MQALCARPMERTMMSSGAQDSYLVGMLSLKQTDSLCGCGGPREAARQGSCSCLFWAQR